MILWHVVVVGGGGSGPVLAARLHADASRRVLLLEASPVPVSRTAFPAGLLDAGRVPGADPQAPTNWRLPRANGHRSPVSRHPRPSPGWFDDDQRRLFRAAATLRPGPLIHCRRPVWSREAALPFLRALDHDLDFLSEVGHGATGPLSVRRPPLDSPAGAALVAPARELGHAAEPDKNAPGTGGVGPVPGNVVDGVRVNTGLADVLPALRRPNFTALGGALVRRVLVERGVATVREIERDGRVKTISASEVMLAAGAIGSAHLLVLSGIGPRAAMDRLGLPLVRDAPVRGFRDHPQVWSSSGSPGSA